MDLGGEHVVNAPRRRVWEALNDPAVLEACIPGLERLEKRSDTEFAATVAARIGPVSARFQGTVQLSALDPPNGYRIGGEGAGGAAGFVKGGAHVRLADADGGATRLTWEADVQVGGKLAQVGSRLIGGTAKRLANEFFSAFSARVENENAADGPPGAAPPADEERPSRPRGRLYWWTAAAVAAVAALTFLAR